MKSLIALSALLLATSSFAQRRPIDIDIDVNIGSLPVCMKRLSEARDRVRDLQGRLQSCELRGSDSRELDFLRSENTRLNAEVDRMRSDNIRIMDENRDLRRQLEDLQGNGRRDVFICSAACTDRYGSLDLRYISTADGLFQEEADVGAKRKAQTSFSCNYGVKTVKCDRAVRPSNNYCVAACTDRYGSLDERYSVGSAGRNVVEAEALALREAQKKYSCNYGVKIKACN